MFYLTYAPGPPINEFVDYFWLFEGAQTARKERIVPSGTIELVINLRDDEIRIYDREQPEQHRRFSGAVLSGTYSRIFVVDAMQHESMLGVHFKPGGAFPFLGALASELRMLMLTWRTFGAGRLSSFGNVCARWASHRERFHVMEEVLTCRLGRSRKGHPAVPIALHVLGPAGTGASIRDVAREVGICQRRFSQCSLLKLAFLRNSSPVYCDFSGRGLWRIRSRNLNGHC